MKKKIIFIIIGLLIVIGIAVCFCLYQFTEVFGKKIIPVKIDTITLRYTPGYDLATAESLNTEEVPFIEVQEIKITGNDLKNIKKALRKVKKATSSKSEAIVVNYELIINNNVKLEVGENLGFIKKGKKNTEVTIPTQLLEEIQRIVEKNNKKVLKVINSGAVTAKLEGASISIKNENNLKYINDILEYYTVTITEDYKKYDNGYKIELILDNDCHVYIYSKVGYIKQKEESGYVVFTKDLYQLIEDIYNKSVE